MKLLYTLLLINLFEGCSKTVKEKKEEPVTCVFRAEPAWLTAKKEEYASCVCLIKFRQAIYQNEQVFEIAIADPFCDGINVVYKYDGTVLLTSSNQADYNQYISTLKNPEILWTCKK